MDWNKFLSLRKQQRRLNIAGSVVTTVVGGLIGAAAVSQMELEMSETEDLFTIFGFDPIMVAVGATIASGFLGYLAGPSIGTMIFKVQNKALLNQFNHKNSVFLKHVIRNRVDASRQSFSNPVPDFYGERITSLKDYKQWLRDCNAYRRKVVDFL